MTLQPNETFIRACIVLTLAIVISAILNGLIPPVHVPTPSEIALDPTFNLPADATATDAKD